MNVQLTRAQLTAFLALVVAVLIVSIVPVLVSGFVGKAVPDSLIAVSDKTVTGLVGVLGTLVGVMWQDRQKHNDDVQPVKVTNLPSDPVPTEDAR